ncbi:MAG: aldo/keto reductase, partial [Candidatus Omnitrophica bacterium]|nr:aldo/keto reductase [Candidatus Omnitrophota bacterium]
MKYRKIGNSDLEVSVVALGTWVFGGDSWGVADDTMSVKVAEKAIEKGINFIDTAPVYGSGRSEEIVGKAIQNKRDKVFLATKCGLEQKGSSIRANLKKEFIRTEIENSLRRLKVEMIDLYQCHWPDPNTPVEETFGELNKLIKEGKIRYIGVSNFDKKVLEDACQQANIVSNQVQYSILERKIEKELVPFCKEKNISILSYGALGGGILTGKYS